jgi:hypothetical protein
MTPDQKFQTLRLMHEARKTRSDAVEVALLKEVTALTQALDQILARTAAPEPVAAPELAEATQ